MLTFDCEGCQYGRCVGLSCRTYQHLADDRQKQHEESIVRQQSKLKVAPWRADSNRPDYVGE